MAHRSQILMARQPIFDAQLRVVAYELLYRTADQTETAQFFNGHQATSSVLVNAYTSIIEKQERRRLPAFINLPREMFEHDSLPAMSQKNLVIEILEDIEVDEALLTSVRRYKENGYRIALDDFIYDPVYEPLLPLVDIVKVDIRAAGMDRVRETVQQLRRFRMTLLAEKIETHEEFRECVRLGFKLFQGYFLRRPEIVEGKRIDGSAMVLLELLAELNKPDPDIQVLVDLIDRDLSLTYRLLKIVNSAALSHRNEINDIREALVLLGLDEVRKWVSLLALSGQQSKPSELTREILLAARLCELLVTRQKPRTIRPETAFLCGILYRLDALLDIQRSELLAQIAISDTLRQAIEGDGSELSLLVRSAYDYCDGRWGHLKISEQSCYQRCYLQSLEWVNETMRVLGS